MIKPRVRFAPSPTGALHSGGVRTALYNYLLAKKYGGSFILRIEDTDRTRYVEGAEEYIIESLKWAGIPPDEGLGFGGEFGPYRQSDRKAMYAAAAQELLQNGNAYIAFDTPEELEKARQADPNFIYNHESRQKMVNSLTLEANEVEKLMQDGTPYVVRLLVQPNEDVTFQDRIRGTVTFNTAQLDDKVLMKADGMPTYHLANIVDDHAMQITHVIRGEEWLPSTAHHVLLYKAFGWGDTVPEFAHLPLILKPEGSGKLSKRDGSKFGMPVFPLAWKAEKPEDSFTGFREAGFIPEAMINFLALLGWSDGTDQEIFTMEELVEKFDLDSIQKSGARFDYKKAKWFNQQYILAATVDDLLPFVRPYAEAKGYFSEDDYLKKRIELMRERAVLLSDFVEEAYYLFEPVRDYDQKTIEKRWNESRAAKFHQVLDFLKNTEYGTNAEDLQNRAKAFMSNNEIGPGDVFPFLRLALAGSTAGPDLFEMMVLHGKQECEQRYAAFLKFV